MGDWSAGEGRGTDAEGACHLANRAGTAPPLCVADVCAQVRSVWARAAVAVFAVRNPSAGCGFGILSGLPRKARFEPVQAVQNGVSNVLALRALSVHAGAHAA